MQIMQVIRHSPESCPLGDPKKLEVMIKWLENIESIAFKYGIKVLGVWTDRWGHTSWVAFEAPSMETFSKFELEPENLARVTFNHIETTIVTTAKETLSFFTQFKKLNP
jgi:hypothetical protein